MKSISGLKTVILFILKRDRWSILIWTVLLAVFTLYVAMAMPVIYPDETNAQMIVDTLKNPAMAAMFGPYFGQEGVYDLGAVFSTEMLMMSMAIVATMAILAVNRHTRKDEEAGRLEMVRSFPVGKATVLTATIIVYTIVSLIVGFVSGLALYAAGLEGVGFEGAMLFGMNFAIAGIFFAALTSVFAQLSQTSRTVLGYAFAYLGAAYILRALGDINNSWLSFFPPFGTLLQTKTLVENNWWPVIAVSALSVVIAYIGIQLNRIRDLDASFIPTKKGRKKASAYLNSIFMLALRNQRTTLISWIVAMFVLGASYGSILGNIEEFFSSNDLYQQLISGIGGNGTMVDRFIVMLYAVIAIVSVIPTVQVIIKLRREEWQGRIEPVLARSVSRTRMLFEYLILSLTISAVTTFSGIAGLYAAGSQVVASPLNFGDMLLAVFAYLPAAWVFISVAVLLLGFVPGLIKIVWAYLGFGFATIYFGGILQLPDWVVKLSPFGYVQKLPLENYSLLSGLVLIIAFIILTFAGACSYRVRNIH